VRSRSISFGRCAEDGAQIRWQASRTDNRITRVCASLAGRRTSLDELPQLTERATGTDEFGRANESHAVAHNEEYRKSIKRLPWSATRSSRHHRLAQVNGSPRRDGGTQHGRRVTLDLDYLRHWSPMLDIKINILSPW
jgi:lipopolysaccharide/colanic/teichoic acid biosynthesis glycosyltransferase